MQTIVTAPQEILTAPQESSLSGHVLDWVALLERMKASDRDGLTRHLTALGRDDRRLRFGVAVEDDFVARYTQGIDFERDVVFGVCAGEGRWMGVGHLVLQGEASELGLSVLPDARGRGLGAAIFRFAAAHAARAGSQRLYMHFLTSNRAILSIARSARMTIHSASGEADAYLAVPPFPEFVRLLMEGPAHAPSQPSVHALSHSSAHPPSHPPAPPPLPFPGQ